MMRSRLYAVVLALLALLTLGAGPAGAVEIPVPPGPWSSVMGKLECLSPPSPANPNEGVTGWLDPGPGKIVDGDPFAKNADVTIYEVYGYAGLESQKFDRGDIKGCAPEFDAANTLTNWTIGLSTTLQALVTRLYYVVFDGGLGDALQPFSELAAQALGWSILLPLLGVAVCATGLWFIARSRRGDLVESISKSAGTLVIIGLGVAAFIYPVTIGRAVDNGMGEAVAAVNQTVAGSRDTIETVEQRKDAVGEDAEQREDEGRLVLEGQNGPAAAGAVAALDAAKQAAPGGKSATSIIASNVHEATLWNSWKQATFGRGNDAAAREFGPTLFKNSAFTRAEAERISKDPSKAKDLREQKQQAYVDAAKKMQKKYPAAYEHLAGKHIGNRFGFWMVGGLLGTLAAISLVGYSLIRLIWASVVTRIGIGAAPIIALGAQFPTFQDKALELVKWVARAIWTAVVFGAITAVYVVGGLGAILSPNNDMHLMVKLLVLVLTSLAVWRLLRRLGLVTGRPKTPSITVPSLRRARGDGGDDAARDVQSPRELFEAPPSTEQPAAETIIRTRTIDSNAVPVRPVLPAGSVKNYVSTERQQTRQALDENRSGARSEMTKGAATGAAMAVATGVATGGTSTIAAAAGAAAKGAAKGALVSGAKGATSHPGSRRGDYDLAERPSAPSSSQGNGAAGLRTRRADSTVTVDPSALYDPSERLPASVRPARSRTEGGTTIYEIYSPAGESR